MTTAQVKIFDPSNVKFTAVSPALTKVRLLSVMAISLPVAIGCAVGAYCLSWWLWLSAMAVLCGLVWISILIPRQVRALSYAEGAEEFIIRRGVLFRSMTIVPYGRMQYVDVMQGPLVRLFGLASIKLHTASASADASLDGLPAAEATRLRDLLTARGEAQLAGL